MYVCLFLIGNGEAYKEAKGLRIKGPVKNQVKHIHTHMHRHTLMHGGRGEDSLKFYAIKLTLINIQAINQSLDL